MREECRISTRAWCSMYIQQWPHDRRVSKNKYENFPETGTQINRVKGDEWPFFDPWLAQTSFFVNGESSSSTLVRVPATGYMYRYLPLQTQQLTDWLTNESKMSSTGTLHRCRIMLIIRTICLLFNCIYLVKMLREDVFKLLDSDAIKMVCMHACDVNKCSITISCTGRY